MWKKGKLSPQDIQKGATAACSDGCQQRELTKLSKVGGSGAFSSNSHRDLLREMSKGVGMPPLYQAAIPVWDTLRNVQTTTIMNFLLPFEMLEALVTADNINEFVQFRPDQITLESDLQAWCRAHNVERAHTMALGLWGDGAPYSHKDSINVVLFNILSGGKRALKRYWTVALLSYIVFVFPIFTFLKMATCSIAQRNPGFGKKCFRISEPANQN